VWIWQTATPKQVWPGRRVGKENTTIAPTVGFYPGEREGDIGTVVATRAAPVDHLNRRRRNARPQKIARERDVAEKRFKWIIEKPQQLLND
jgi:hypothetical protein